MLKNFKFLNKKGNVVIEELLEHLGKLGLLAFIIIILLNYVKSIQNDTEFQKIFLSRDIALLTSTLYDPHGEVTYIYSFNNLDLSKFKIEARELSSSDDKPIIRVESGGIGKSYPYHRSFQSKDTFSISGAKSIKFSKTESSLVVTKHE